MSSNSEKMPKIGAFVLETLTTGMYTNSLDTLREYIQNSFDSIRESERSNKLTYGAGRIDLTIDEKSRILKLRDNGLGIPKNEVKSRLVNIGMSSKTIQHYAGFRGIGRLAGIAYCDRLIFTTQAKDENEFSRVVFNCRELRNAMSPKLKQISELAEVINEHASVTNEKTRNRGHFFEVLMEGINEAGQSFLDWKIIENYLSQIAPVGLDTQSFYHAGEIIQWLKKRNIDVPTVSITINAGLMKRQVFKPYRKLTYTTAQEKHKIHLKKIRFFPDDAGPDSPFWGWYAETNCPGTIGDERVAGIRLRKDNIGIGMAENMTKIFAEASESYARLNKYFMGEIHIQDPNIIPNARRDGFEEGPEWLKVRQSLVEFAKERSREAYHLSQARNLDIERLLGAAKREKESAQKRKKTGLASKEEKEKVLGKLDRQIAKLEAAKKSDRDENERKQIDRTYKELQNTRQAIENETHYVAQNLNSALDKKQRKIISEIIGILYDVLDDGSFEKARAAILAKYQIPNKKRE